jgi:hypothetical protein
MSTEGENVADTDLHKLRADAMDRAQRLLQQLQADHADLRQWRERRRKTTLETEPGIDALAKVIEAAQRVRAELQDG